jgi:WD40 repeat protein
MKRKSLFVLLLGSISHLVFSQEPKLMLPIGHSLGVATAIFSPDGKRIVTASLDNSVKIWEAGTGLLLANLIGHTDTVATASFSPDGKLILSAGEDGTAKLWDANSGVLIADIKAHTEKIRIAAFSPDGKKFLTTTEKGSFKLWDVATAKLLVDFKGHTQMILEAWFSRNGKKIATASIDSTAKIWDAETGKILLDLKDQKNEVHSISLSPDGKKAVTGSADSTAKVWDAQTGKMLFDLKKDKGSEDYTIFSPDGKEILTVSDNGFARIFDAETGKLLHELERNKKGESDKSLYPSRNIAISVSFSPDGKKILVGFLFNSVKIWDVSSGKLLRDIQGENDYMNSASFSADGKKYALALAYGHAQIWDLEKGSMLIDLRGGANFIHGFFYTSDNKRIVVVNQFGSAKIFDAGTGAQIANISGDKILHEGVTIGMSPDEKKMVAVANDNTPKVYDAITGAALFELRGHSQPVWNAFFSHNGKKIYTASHDSTCKIWDAVTGKLLFNFKTNNSFPEIRLSPDDKIAATYSDSLATVWNVENGQPVTEINSRGGILNLYFSPDGKKIHTESYEVTDKIWDAASGKLLLEFKEPDSRYQTLTFSPDGKKIIVINENQTTRIATAKMLNAETGELIAGLKPQGSSFRYSVVFSADSKQFFIPMNEGCVTIWNAETGAFIKELKGLEGPLYLWAQQSFSPDKKKLVMGSRGGIVNVWDIETGNVTLVIKDSASIFNSAFFSPDGKKIVTNSGDEKKAKVYDAETGEFLYAFVSVNKDDYLVLDKYNHYDGTDGGRKSIYFTCGTEVIELDQLKDQLWVPNLVERVLNRETINAAKLSDLNICNLTPVVDTIEQSALQYRFRITPRLGGLSATIVYVNGIEIKRYTPQQLMKQNGDYQLAIDKKEIQKFFVPGKENSITIKSLTAKNSISSRSVSINEKANEKSIAAPNLYAVIVGVSDYKGEGLDLKFAAKDAIDMASALDISAKKLLNTDGKEHVFIYKIHTSAGRDKFPEKNSIKQIFTEIGTKAQPNDILLIFFAGHGVVEAEKNQFYFLTADASSATLSGALKNVGIGTEELAEWIQPQVMKAQKRILIFDACNSGQALKEIISFNNDAKNLLASRGDENGKQKKAIEKLNEKSGMFILSASASDQKAYEIGKYNQGALTYSLLKAIKEQPDILEDRQYLNISRWFGAAEKTVGELARETGTRQQPQVVSTSNFNIGVVDDDVRNKIVLPFEKFLFTRSEFRNTELRIDNLKLRSLIDKELSDLSDDNSNALLLFNPEYEGANIYSLSCDYTVAGSDVNVYAVLIKGGVEIKTKFEVKGKADNLTHLSGSIISEIKDWLSKSK